MLGSPPVDTTLPTGAIIDRYGPLSGHYAGEPGTTISQRGMAIGAEDMSYTKLRVLKPITVSSGPTAAVPEFGTTGNGTQYFFDKSVQWWLDNGYIEIVS